MPAEGTISANNRAAIAQANQVFDGHFLPQECLPPELDAPDYDRLLSQIDSSWHANGDAKQDGQRSNGLKPTLRCSSICGYA